MFSLFATNLSNIFKLTYLHVKVTEFFTCGKEFKTHPISSYPISNHQNCSFRKDIGSNPTKDISNSCCLKKDNGKYCCLKKGIKCTKQ